MSFLQGNGWDTVTQRSIRQGEDLLFQRGQSQIMLALLLASCVSLDESLILSDWAP